MTNARTSDPCTSKASAKHVESSSRQQELCKLLMADVMEDPGHITEYYCLLHPGVDGLWKRMSDLVNKGLVLYEGWEVSPSTGMEAQLVWPVAAPTGSLSRYGVLGRMERPVWATPQELFDRLDAEFHFDLDPCSTDENHKCPMWYTEDDDGLAQVWEGNVFVNPPYGKTIGKWMEKAYVESQTNAELVACLVFMRTDTRWWHDWIMKAAEIRPIRGRLKFLDQNIDTRKTSGSPMPSVIVIFRNGCVGPPVLGETMNAVERA